MRAKSKMQRKVALQALSVHKGEQDKSRLKGAAKTMYETFSREALTEMAEPRPLSHRLTSE